jgi:hypothetical protein
MKRSEFNYLQDISMADLMYGSDTLKDVAPELTEDMFGIEGVDITDEEAKQAVGVIADVTPFVGSAKAATELPEDISFVQDLISEGYSEGDIKKMGLGGAYGILTVAGFVPGTKIATDLVKSSIQRGVKETASDVAEQTARAFKADPASMDSERKQRLIRLSKELPPSRRKQFIKEGLRPTPKVFHGAPTLGDTDERLLKDNYLVSILNTYREKYVDTPVKELREKFGNQIGSEELSKELVLNPISIPVVLQSESGKYVSTYDIVGAGDITLPNGKGAKLLDLYDEDGKFIKKIPLTKTDDGKINMSDISAMTEDQQLETQLETDTFFNDPDQITTSSRAAQLEEEGRFQPYRDPAYGGFAGARGLTSDTASGRHAELKEQAISLSRDPLVSMKSAFGGKRLDNIVVSNLPKSLQRNLKPSDYDAIESGQVRLSDVLADLDVDEIESLYAEAPEFAQKILDGKVDMSKIGISLPKSKHLEAEVASKTPEELGVTRLSSTLEDTVTEAYGIGSQRTKNIGKLPLKERVREGQKIANTIVNSGSYIEGVPSMYANKSYTQMLADNPYGKDKAFRELKPSQKYNIVKQFFNDLQSLGQFTEQYGARGTYDSLLETATDRSKFINALDELARELPAGSEKKRNIQNIQAVLKSISEKKPPLPAAEDMTGRSVGRMKDRDLLDLIDKQVKYNNKVARWERKAAIVDDEFVPPRPTLETDPVLDQLTYNDSKRALFLMTQKLNRGGLMAKR